jgi:hypothetical protein
MPIFLIAPAIGWAWPALVPIVGAVASALGYQAFSDPKGILRGAVSQELDNIRIERVALDSVLAAVIAEEIGTEERIILKRDEVILVFRKDAQGKFYVDVLGPSEMNALELRALGEEFARELVQKFAYHKITEQLERANITVIEEKVEQNGNIVLRNRKWE